MFNYNKHYVLLIIPFSMAFENCAYSQAIVTAIQNADNCNRHKAEAKFDVEVQNTEEEKEMCAQTL